MAKSKAPAAKPAKAAKSAKVEKPVKAVKAAKEEKPAKAEKPAKVEKPVKAEKVPKAEKVAAKKEVSGAADPIWLELQRKHGEEKAMAYDMKNQYNSSTPLNHKILGWGWILSNENDRLEVVFKDGKRVLISNYKK